MADPDTIDGWLHLVRQHELAALTLAENKVAAAQGFHHAGVAVECALKAYIIKVERLNSWPSRDARPELYTHDLRALCKIAGVVLDTNSPTAPGWHLCFQWDRNQWYDPNPMPRRVARSMCEAAFGSNGVVTWIRQKLK